MSDITWTNTTVKLGDMQPWERNPKKSTKKQAQKMLESWDKFGQVQTVAIGPGLEVYDGHQRLSALLTVHGKGYEIDARQSSRELTEEEREQLVITLHAGATGSWDWGELANWDATSLQEWGFDADALSQWNADAASLSLMLESEQAEDGESAPDSPEQAKQTLAERFGVPPFSVLDARQGYWQERKRAWLALGIQSELGRGITEDSQTYRSDYGGYDPTMGHRANATPGGSLLEAANLNADWKTDRGDGRGRTIKGRLPAVIGGQPLPLDRMANNKSPARKFGQDLMRGEHTVGENRRPKKELATSNSSQARLTALQKTGSSELKTIGTTDWMQSKGLSGGCSDGDEAVQSGTSIFDPVLCELAYTWFCPPGGVVLDPFAGGSVRGIVAAVLGLQYIGLDLRSEQVEANREQAADIVPDNLPRWIVGNSLTDIPDEPIDFIFSCPPYYDLEIYSERDGDLSNAETYADFLTDYRSIVAQAVSRLSDNRFACFCVGDIRDKKGFYRNFVSDTIAAFQDAGAVLYNEAILVTAVGSLPIRAGKQFSASRKLGKTHQNVLVFFKGDPKAIRDVLGDVDVIDLDSPDDV